MTSAWPPESSRRGRQRGTTRLAIEQGADGRGGGAWPARLGADDGGDGAWPARLGAAGAVMGRDRQGRDAADGRRVMACGRWGAADGVGRDRRGRRGRRAGWGKGGSGRTVGRSSLFQFYSLFYSICLAAAKINF